MRWVNGYHLIFNMFFHFTDNPVEYTFHKAKVINDPVLDYAIIIKWLSTLRKSSQEFQFTFCLLLSDHLWQPRPGVSPVHEYWDKRVSAWHQSFRTQRAPPAANLEDHTEEISGQKTEGRFQTAWPGYKVKSLQCIYRKLQKYSHVFTRLCYRIYIKTILFAVFLA